MRTYFCTVITSLSLAAFLTGCGQRTQKKSYGVPPDMKITSATTADYLTVHYYALRYCMNCHRDRVHPIFSSYESLVEQADKVKDQLTTDSMPPVEDGYSSLTACQKLVFTTWLNAGMPKSNGPTLGAAGNACY